MGYMPITLHVMLVKMGYIPITLNVILIKIGHTYYITCNASSNVHLCTLIHTIFL